MECTITQLLPIEWALDIVHGTVFWWILSWGDS